MGDESSYGRRTELIRLREAAGYTQESIAEALEVSRSSVLRWESGLGGMPHPATRARISAVLGLTADELEAVFGEPRLELVSPGGLVTGPAVGIRRPATSGAFTGVAVGRAQLDIVEQAIFVIVAQYEHTGPAIMSARALELQTKVMGWLNASPRMRDRVELYRLAAQLNGLLGYMAVNVGRFRLADAFCGEGLHLADEAGDLDLHLWLRGTQAHSAYYEGNWDLAIAYARAGIDKAPTNPQAIRLLVNGEARSQSKLGRRPEAEQAVGLAMDLLDHQQLQPGLTPCIAFEPYGYPRLAANAATAHVAAGNIDRVLAFTHGLDTEVESLNSAWSRALIGLDVATTLLMADQPEVDEAMRLGMHAIDACGGRPIRSVWQRALELRHLSTRWDGHSATADYQEAFRDWSTNEATMAVADQAA